MKGCFSRYLKPIETKESCLREEEVNVSCLTDLTFGNMTRVPTFSVFGIWDATGYLETTILGVMTPLWNSSGHGRSETDYENGISVL